MARQSGPIVVSIINMKGGVGKSTIAALLCRHASLTLKLDVLAIDLDPQANLSQAFMGAAYKKFLDEGWPSIVEIFKGYQPPTAKTPHPRPLSPNDVVQGSSRLGSPSLQIIPSRFDFSDNLSESLRPDPKVLAKYIAENFQHKDLIIIDCAPTESVLTRAAYHASGLILVPVKPEFFATIGFPLLQQSLTTFRRQNRGQHIDVTGIVINNAFYNGGNNGGPEKATALQEIATEAQENNWTVFKNEIPLSRGFPKLMRGNYTYQGNAPLFRLFAQEFFKKIGL